MDIKEAVVAAKGHVKTLFSGDGEKDFTLEEVDFDDRNNEWLITVGYLRENSFSRTSTLIGSTVSPRLYPRIQKVVRISNIDGTIKSVKNRESSRAA